jgi:hypothetical protein
MAVLLSTGPTMSEARAWAILLFFVVVVALLEGVLGR